MLAACASTPVSKPLERTPEEVRAQLEHLIPQRVEDRRLWATDIQSSFASLKLPPSTDNLCAVLAVIEQETGYRANPEVPGLPGIARLEIDRRAAALRIPRFAVDAALLLPSGEGRSFGDRVKALRTEKDMSDLFEELIARVPLGQKLFAQANPVRTGGSMQVAIAFAEDFSERHGYPHDTGHSIRDEIFTRRGGLYFGIAHLLKYPNSYERHIYRYADFNAGWYASRNAAFQRAVGVLANQKLIPDGDLRIPDTSLFSGRREGETERAVLALSSKIAVDEAQIRRDLSLEDSFSFEETPTWRAVFRLADARTGKPFPRAAIPQITLKSPKITRKLTTEWFANRVQERYQQCINRAYANPQ